MTFDILPFRFHIDTITLAGIALWGLALYLTFFPVGEWVAEQMSRWFDAAERSLYTSTDEYERTRQARESQNAFYASIFSVIPFVVAGGFLNWGLELTLGSSWSISLGMILAMGGGIYELGRRSN
jgi:hypothetical protein